MKKFLPLLFVLLSQYVYAQTIDYNKIILPTNADSISIEEKLVQLAWQNHPLNEVAILSRHAAQKNVTIEKLAFLNRVAVTFNANEGTVANGLFSPLPKDANGKVQIQQGIGFFPRYNASLTLSIGDFINTPVRVKKEKINVQIADARINAEKVRIRAEVLSRYQIYMNSIEILKLRVKALEEAHLIHLLVTKKFKKGEALLEDYNKSFLTFNQATEAKVTSESQVFLAKISLEEIIGVRLEEVTGGKYEPHPTAKKGDTIVTASGLKYVVTEPGFGEKPKPGQTVKVFYTGKFMNGKEFENNLKDTPFRITLGVQQVIQGWEEGILLMKEGEKGTLIIPARLAYGHQGIKDPSNEGGYLVPPDTPVIYDIELVDVK